MMYMHQSEIICAMFTSWGPREEFGSFWRWENEVLGFSTLTSFNI